MNANKFLQVNKKIKLENHYFNLLTSILTECHIEIRLSMVYLLLQLAHLLTYTSVPNRARNRKKNMA